MSRIRVVARSHEWRSIWYVRPHGWGWLKPRVYVTCISATLDARRK